MMVNYEIQSCHRPGNSWRKPWFACILQDGEQMYYDEYIPLGFYAKTREEAEVIARRALLDLLEQRRVEAEKLAAQEATYRTTKIEI